MKKIVLFVLFLTLMASAASADLVGYWAFNEGSGTLAGDSSTYGNDGTVGPTAVWVPGRYGTALEFSSSLLDSVVVVPDAPSLDISSHWTVMAWVNSQNDLTDRFMVTKWDTSLGESFRFGQNLDHTFEINFLANTNTGTLHSNRAVAIGQWTHLAVTYDGMHQRFYVDGVLTVVTLLPEGIFIGDAALNIGGQDGLFGFDGAMDEVRIYNHALTDNEIFIAQNLESLGVGTPPTADAGDDITATENSSVVLDGSGSTDDDGTIEYYSWLRLPDNDLICFSTAPTCQTTTLGRAAEVLELTVTDNDGNSDSDTVTILHQPPSVCGDGQIELGEVCDSNSQSCTNAGGYLGMMDCNSTCDGFDACLSSDFCGDTTINGSEICDGGSQVCVDGFGYNGTQNCNLTCNGYDVCIATESCGDTILNGLEICDSTNQACVDGSGYNGFQDCNASCDGYDACAATESCGDAILNGSELCDGGSQPCITADNYAGSRSCNGTCDGYDACVAVESCGDGVVNGDEVCDNNAQVCQIEGVGSGTQACNATCDGFDTCVVNPNTDYTQDAYCEWASDMDQTTGDIINQCNGGGNDGVVIGATLGVPGYYGNAVSFDDVDDVIETGDVDIANDLTIVAWVYDRGNGGPVVAKRGDEPTNNYGMHVTTESKMIFYYTPGVWHLHEENGNSVSDGIWRHMAVTYTGGQGSTMQFYVDGNLISSRWTLRTGNTNFPLDNQNMTIGGVINSSAISEVFDGEIDEVGVFSRILSQAEIQEVMNHGLRGGNVVAPDPRPKLMPLGASITQGVGDTDPDEFGYRDHLQDQLGVGTYRFVGAFSDPNSDPTYEVNHSGVSGDTTAQTEARLQTELDNFFTTPVTGDAITIHVGTNDVLTGLSLSDAVDNVEDIIDMIDAHDPAIDIYIALVIPVNNAQDSDIVTFNALIESMIIYYQVSKSNVHSVDMYSVFQDDAYGLCGGDWTTCMDDDIHPNDTGYEVMAMQWASCISGSTNTYCNGN